MRPGHQLGPSARRRARCDPPIAVGGVSAGGDLAAVVANRPAVVSCFQLLVYPVTAASSAYYVDNADVCVRTATGMRWFYDQYVTGDDGRPEGRRLSPLLEDSGPPGSAPSTLVRAVPDYC